MEEEKELGVANFKKCDGEKEKKNGEKKREKKCDALSSWQKCRSKLRRKMENNNINKNQHQ